MDLKSGSWNAPDCQILLFENKTNNTMGRDILRKLGITLTASKNTDKRILKHDVLTNEEMWRYDGLSEDNLDIAYNEPENPTPISIDSDESDNMPLRPRSPQEARNNATRNQQKNQGPSTESNWTNEKVKKQAQANQQQQQKTPKRKASAKRTPPRTPKTNKRKLAAAKSPAQVSFNMRAQQAALNYASESSKTKGPSINKSSTMPTIQTTTQIR